MGTDHASGTPGNARQSLRYYTQVHFYHHSPGTPAPFKQSHYSINSKIYSRTYWNLTKSGVAKQESALRIIIDTTNPH